MEVSIDLIGAVTLGSTMLVFFYKKVLKPGVKMFKDWFVVVDKINKIHDELHANGGSSIRDAINRIEGKLVAVEQRQSMYLMESPKGIFETDKEGRFLSVNRTYCRMAGKTEKELLGMNWINSITGEDRDRVVEKWSGSVDEKMEFFCNYEMVNSNNETFYVHMSAYPMENPSTKNIIGWIGSVSIIDE